MAGLKNSLPIRALGGGYGTSPCLSEKIMDQARRQVEAAAGLPIEWHVAEEDVATKLRSAFSDEGLPIKVIFDP